MEGFEDGPHGTKDDLKELNTFPRGFPGEILTDPLKISCTVLRPKQCGAGHVEISSFSGQMSVFHQGEDNH